MFKFIHQYRILIGFLLWLAWMLAKLPQPLDIAWGRGMLLLASFVVVPVVSDVLARTAPFSTSHILPKIIRWQLPAAALFALAFWWPNGWLSTLCVLPWVGVNFAMAWVGGLRIWHGAWRRPAEFGISAGLFYLSVAGVWAVMERAGIIPFGFNPEIIFLTIVHFHYAGFVLPVLAGLASRQLGNPVFSQITCYLAVAGVGLLAVGITLTQLGVGHEFELVSAWFMALSAVAVAAMQLGMAFQKGVKPGAQFLWVMSALALFGGMLFAALYGARFLAPIAWLDIPMMRALHGTLNAVGFAGLGVAGHWLRPTVRP